MDKYEYTIKSEKIKKLVERKDYETAAKIADTIDWERVKNVKLLSTVSQAYEKAGRYEEAKDMLLMAYDRAPVGRRFLSKLTELAVKQGNFDEAEEYLKEFTAASPQDPSRLLLLYEIAKARGESVERLTMILEAYQKREFEEKWSYELAELYFQAGKTDACVKLCDEIVLWFGVGAYVDKAMELKQRIMPLSPEQMEKQENKEKYLRRLEDVQREFAKKEGRPAKASGAVQEGGAKSVAELAAEALREQAATVEPAAEGFQEETPEGIREDQEESAERTKIRSIQEARIHQEEQTKIRRTRDEEKRKKEQERLLQEEAERMRREEAERLLREEEERRRREAELTREIEEKAALEMANLQAEMEASLAREIETEAMSATINEAMLRKTAAAMEEVGAVENNHSDDSERTKIAAGPFSEKTKTKEFVIQARAISRTLEEVGDSPITAREVEARIEREIKAAVETEAAEHMESKAVQPATVESKPSESRSAEPKRGEYESIGPVPAKEDVMEPSAPEQTVAESETAAGAEPMAEVETAAGEEAAAAEVKPSAEALSAENPPAGHPSATGIGEVQDHYVLIASDNEESGLHECVAYIRRMRELLGCPASQVAKISGAKLATKNIEKILAKLQGRDLIVVGIAALPTEVLSQTIECMAGDQKECFIALIDTEQEIDRLRKRMAFFADCRVLSCEGAGRIPMPVEIRQEVTPAVTAEPVVSAKSTVQVDSNAMPMEDQNEMPSVSEQRKEPEPRPEHSGLRHLANRGPRLAQAEVKALTAPGPEPEPEPTAEAQPAQSRPPAAGGQPDQAHRTLAQLVEEALNTGSQTPGPSEGSPTEAIRREETPSEPPQEVIAAKPEEVKPEESKPEEVKPEVKAADEMSPNDFFDFAVEYARMLDAVVDDMGGLALFAEIEEYQQERVALTEELAQELVEKAILRAERRSIRSFFSNRYDKEGYLILKEEHFKE